MGNPGDSSEKCVLLRAPEETSEGGRTSTKLERS